LGGEETGRHDLIQRNDPSLVDLNEGIPQRRPVPIQGGITD
jgi:hypothetical protein